MFGFSVYPHHLKDKTACSLDSFCEMIARTADRFGVDYLGLGTDLCQWFKDNRDFGKIQSGLAATGMNTLEVEAIMGLSW